MIFHKEIEEVYKAQLFVRCDDIGIAHYFSAGDFEGLNAERYEFTSSKGNRLVGYFYSYDNYDVNRLIVFDHGFGGGHRSYMKEIEKLCSFGYKVFAYDHTGCMESDGENTGGLSQSLCDLNDVLNTLKEDSSVYTENLYVIGHSWGGYSTLNISAIHADIKKIVVLSGFASVKRMTEQNFKGFLRFYINDIIKLEGKSNPEFIAYDAIETLRNSSVCALLIYSDNDHLVSREHHYDVLYNALKDKENIEFILEKEKGHNPNYTREAVKYLAEYSSAAYTASELSPSEKEEFRNSYDWHRMTEQDEEIWSNIRDFLIK